MTSCCHCLDYYFEFMNSNRLSLKIEEAFIHLNLSLRRNKTLLDLHNPSDQNQPYLIIFLLNFLIAPCSLTYVINKRNILENCDKTYKQKGKKQNRTHNASLPPSKSWSSTSRMQVDETMRIKRKGKTLAAI